MAGEGGLKMEDLSAEGPADPAAAKTGVAGAAAAAATAAGRVKEAGATLVGQSKPWGGAWWPPRGGLPPSPPAPSRSVSDPADPPAPLPP